MAQKQHLILRLCSAEQFIYRPYKVGVSSVGYIKLSQEINSEKRPLVQFLSKDHMLTFLCCLERAFSSDMALILLL